MRVTVRRPGQSAQPVTSVRKRPEDGLVKRSVKRPTRRSHAMTGESSAPCGVPTGDAEDIVVKSAPPWIGRWTTVPTGAPPPPLLHHSQRLRRQDRPPPTTRHPSTRPRPPRASARPLAWTGSTVQPLPAGLRADPKLRKSTQRWWKKSAEITSSQAPTWHSA